jgi:hypothetical protein
VKKQVRLHQEIHALEIISRYAQDNISSKSTSVEKLLRSEQQQKDGDLDTQEILSQVYRSVLNQFDSIPVQMKYDFVIMFRWFEDWEKAIQILNPLPMTESALWLRVELLLEGRKYLELIETLNSVEKMIAQNPETFLASAYFRAQA